MFTQQDLEVLAKRGISVEKAQSQLESFAKGFPYLKLKSAASLDYGIMSIDEDAATYYQDLWTKYLAANKQILKFVPASGAASRMFKNMFEFISADYNVPTTDFEKKFFAEIEKFAFYAELDEKCKKNEGKDIQTLVATGQYKAVVENLLLEKGLNYGNLPKGLLTFHRSADSVRKAFEEHLVEGALYAANGEGQVNLHFTVSPEHLPFFQQLVSEKQASYEKRFGVKYHISFSVQKASTDTMAAAMDNTPFRDEKGQLLFRPGGHGALIENLNEQDADVIFVKNIDNVVPDGMKPVTVKYKQIIGGVLVSLQQKIFSYLQLLEGGKYTHEQLIDMLYFLQKSLYVKNPETKNLDDTELAIYIKQKLNRPLRVCGMVRNAGEPGGGPFIAQSQDGTYQDQILESSQIDMNDPEAVAMFKQGSHFNPVDLVCAVRDKNGKSFDLLKHVDHQTGFISFKSKNGRELKALELPGLWNGAMSDWNTVFVEVPMETFNPVKTVNDLLRPQHQ
ncbi:MAG: DUF4301 family protein [Bacteroidales bacterium]|nr:DUF4301 family protein [Candidatus Liminaster caballi]